MIVMEGALSVKAVMQARRRLVERLIIDEKKKDRDTAFILRLARQQGIAVERTDRQRIHSLASGHTHGGIVALVQPRQYQNVQDCLDQPLPFVAVLEGIEDPYNLGYAFRSLYAAGCSGVLTAVRDWSAAESTLVKSSAGASEWLPWCQCENLAESVGALRRQGCVLYCAQRSPQAIDYFDAQFTQPFILAIGGERRGLGREILAQSDQNVVIPYGRSFRAALNGCSAVAALSFEVVRQRRNRA